MKTVSNLPGTWVTPVRERWCFKTTFTWKKPFAVDYPSQLCLKHEGWLLLQWQQSARRRKTLHNTIAHLTPAMASGANRYKEQSQSLLSGAQHAREYASRRSALTLPMQTGCLTPTDNSLLSLAILHTLSECKVPFHFYGHMNRKGYGYLKHTHNLL